jgi:hypothetical protein
VHGLEEPPPGELVLVIPRRAGITGFFKVPVVFQAVVEARAVVDKKES